MEKVDKKLRKRHYFVVTKLISTLLTGLALLFATNVKAGLQTISDEETEQYLTTLIQPIFKTAGIPFNQNKIFIVEDDSLNAFVTDGNKLFINTGVILQANNSDEIRGVIAHETGHILGGHIIRHKLRQKELYSLSLTSMVIAGAVGAASGQGDIAAAVAIGSQSSLMNKSLSYRIEEERNADEAAVMLLNKSGYSPQGLLSFMQKIKQQNKLQGISDNEYFHTHPLSHERIAFLQQAVVNSPYKISTENEAPLKRVKAKLYAFIKTPQQTYMKYNLSNKTIEADYARAVAAYKSVKFDKALKLIDSLIKKEPNNPHFRELKGQILSESGKIQEAKNEFSYAVKLMPSSALFKINEAQSILEVSPSKPELKRVILQLQNALHQKQNLFALLLLSRAYEMNGDKAEALYAAAEYSMKIGNYDLAKKQAEKAKIMSKNTHLRLRAEDLLQYIKNIKKR